MNFWLTGCTTLSLQVKDGHSNFNYTDEEIRDIFVRPRRTTILNKHREFQYKLIHGVIYTKEQLLNTVLLEIVVLLLPARNRNVCTCIPTL